MPVTEGNPARTKQACRSMALPRESFKYVNRAACLARHGCGRTDTHLFRPLAATESSEPVSLAQVRRCRSIACEPLAAAALLSWIA